MVLRLTLLSTFIALQAPAALAAAEADRASFAPSDLLSLESAADPQISPDGKRVAYVRRTNDPMTDRTRPSIWMVDVATGRQTPVAAGSAPSSQPRWSPDGTRLAYVSSEGGSGQIHIFWVDGRASAAVTSLPAAPSSLAWSPDGRQIAFAMDVPERAPSLGSAPDQPQGAKWAPPLQVITANQYRRDGEGYLKPGYTHLFVVPADGGAPRQISFGKANDAGPLSWTADGRHILFSARRTADQEADFLNTDIFAAAVDGGGGLSQLTSRVGPDDQPTVSPDGRHIAFIGYDDSLRSYDNVLLYVMDRDGRNARALTLSLDRSVDAPRWSRDGRWIYFKYEDRGDTRIAKVSLDGHVVPVADGVVTSDIDRPYTGGGYSLAGTGAVAFTGGDAMHPADIYVGGGKKPRRLTRLNDDLLGRKNLAGLRKLPVRTADGRAIDAWLMMPPDAQPGRRYPLILEIHGGPFAAYGPSFSTDNQLYAAAGYAILYANPRGSTSYGDAFANLIHRNFPGQDYGDLMDAVDAAIATGEIDRDNLFVTGGSGGGLLTAWIVGKTNRFKAAVAQKPAINWLSMALTNDTPGYAERYWFAKMPWEDPMEYWNRSPLSLVGNVTTPTMIVVGNEDYRAPIGESDQYYAALRLKRLPTALVIVPGASHALAARPSQSAARVSAILAWFDRYRTRAAK